MPTRRPTLRRPRHRRPRATLALLRHGYRWSERLRRSLPEGADPDAVPVRMLGRPALVVRGPQGVRTFTDTSLFRRRDAMPKVVSRVLFGAGAVHGLDDEAHLARKALFVEATRPASVEALVAEVDRRWASRIGAWRPGQEVVVEDEAIEVIGQSVLHWAGVPVTPREANAVARKLAAVVDGFGVVGPANLRARWCRVRLNLWAGRVVRRARRGAPTPPEGSALALASGWRDEQGQVLPARLAGIELQNLLRPTVAVSRFVAFGASELVQRDDWRDRLRTEHEGRDDAPGAGPLALAFAHEVRRLTPFVPVLAAVARRPVTFHGHEVPAGSRVLLDVVGTLRDGRHWPDPLRFDPVRFLGGQDIVADALVPQGGGEVATGHRCPGEEVTLGVLAVSCAALASARWLVPPQGLDVDEHRMPTRPAGGVRLVVATD